MKTIILAAAAAGLFTAATFSGAGAAAAAGADMAASGHCLPHRGDEIRCLERREPTRAAALVTHTIRLAPRAVEPTDTGIRGSYEFWTSSCGGPGTGSGVRRFSLAPGQGLQDSHAVMVQGAAPPPVVTAPRCFEAFAFDCRLVGPDGSERPVACDLAVRATTSRSE